MEMGYNVRGHAERGLPAVARVRPRRRSGCVARNPRFGDIGELKWDGASGCYFMVDPKQDMFFVLMEQTPSERQRIQRRLKLLIYEAMEK